MTGHEGLDLFRKLKEAGKLPDLLTKLNLDPQGVEQETARLAATDVTAAEAYVIGLTIGLQCARVAAELDALIASLSNVVLVEFPTGPTGPTDGRGVE